MGVTNQRSLGWSIAAKLHEAGCQLAFSYQGERLKGELEKLTKDIDEVRLYQVDVTNSGELNTMVSDLKEAWGELDYVVHSIAFAPREAMDGRYIDTTRDDWVTALEISAYSLVAAAQALEDMLNENASMVTLTYYAAEKVVPKYNVMGVAKSALEASVRYLAYDLGKKGVRINAVSAGPVKTVAARSHPGLHEDVQARRRHGAPRPRRRPGGRRQPRPLPALRPGQRHHRRDGLRRRRLPRDGDGPGRRLIAGIRDAAAWLEPP